ncbi:MAG: OB-fold nucleic acid binding domain-containing protein [Streptococcus sp.]
MRQTRAGKNYLAFVFQDETGTIEGKLWDAQPHNVESFTAGRVVHASGRREVYNQYSASQSIEHALATSR